MTMRAALILAGSILFLSAAGCAAPDDRAQGYDDETRDRLEYWIGASDRELVLKIGAPDAVYQMQDGNRILTWRQSRTENRGGEVYTVVESQDIDGAEVVVPVTRQKPTITWRYECVLSIEIDSDGYIVGYATEGNNCSVPPPPY